MKRFMTCMALTATLGLVMAGAAVADDKGGGSKGGSGGASKGSSGGSTSGKMGGNSGSKSGQTGSGSGGSKGGQSGGSSKNGSSQSQSNGSKGKGKVDSKNHGGKFDNKHGNFKDYHSKHGQKFSHGWCYQGNHHSHWSNWCWNSHWGCYNFWCPSSSCWYYWYEPACCYYPMTYVQTCTPVAYASPQVVPASAAPIINIQNSVANGGGVAANNVPGIPPPPQP